MKRTPVIVIAVSWINAVNAVRTFIWATNPSDALMWTIRWDFALSVDGNIIHASDSPESAEIELKRFFWWKDLFDYKKITDEVM
jgi:nucleoside-diphosphate kinase